MLTRGWRWLVFGLGIGLLLVSTDPGFAAGQKFLRDHVPAAVSEQAPLGRLPNTTRLQLAIGLPLRNEAALDELIREIADPASPKYRQYLTPQQFAEQFGPTEQEYQAVIDFARANGLMVTARHGNRLLLDVSGSAAQVEQAFHVTLQVYRHPSENRNFYSPDAEPSVDAALPILDVSGLSDFSRPHPRYVVRPASETPAVAPRGGAGSGPTGNYLGNDFRAAYAPGVSLTGAGQTVALVQFDGYYPSDITNYENLAGLPNVTLTNVLLDGFNGIPTTGTNSGNIEVSLDIEMVISMAPGVSRIILYEGNPTNGLFIPNDVLNRIATDNAASQVSSSWGWNGGPDATTENIFKQMIAQGQSFFSASGDSDAYPAGVLDNPAQITEPSSSTNVIQVGGTTLLATNPVSETVWNWGLFKGSYLGSSGGISSSNAIPVWQTGISMTANHGSTTKRNVPDVALTADNVFVKYGNGLSVTDVMGTSCAAPLWAGFTALINQLAAAKGWPSVGFINPTIYAIGKGANYNADFHDVTAGNNFWPGSTTNFPAVAGYDLCTGWGTPNGSNLISALAAPDAFGITPGTAFLALGPVGGPFTTSARNYFLTNSGGTLLSWSLLGKPAWLDISAAGGALATGGSLTLAASLNSTAYSLPAGNYATNLTFTNLSSGVGQSRQFSLLVGQSIVQNGGFETGDFSYWTLTNDIYSRVDNGSVSAISPHSGTYLAALGQSSTTGQLFQALSTVPNQVYLLSLWLNSPSVSGGNTPNEFSVAWNGATLFSQANIGPIGWTNLMFIVTATNSRTTLQFWERVDPSYLGLDDVNVWPIPNPSFRSVARTNGNNVVFSWNALAGIAYQVQYSTNLAKTNWISIGTNNATGPVLTFTNAYGSDPRRFYRIRRLP